MDQRLTTSTTSARAVNASMLLTTVSKKRMVGSPMPEKSGCGHVDIITQTRNIITRLRNCSKRNRLVVESTRFVLPGRQMKRQIARALAARIGSIHRIGNDRVEPLIEQ